MTEKKSNFCCQQLTGSINFIDRMLGFQFLDDQWLVFNYLSLMKIQKYLEQSPVFALNAAYERVIPKVNQQLKEDGLNLIQGLVLTALFFEQRKDVSPSQLAQLFQTSRGNMSHILSHLEAKGWVRRAVNSKDARQFQIELKADGRKKAIHLIKFYDKLQTHFEKEMGGAGCSKFVQSLATVAATYQNSFKSEAGQRGFN